MDALLSAARSGAKTGGTRLYVTTFPCHNCARHIVSAGVGEVRTFEPYLKSQAIPLHGDAIVTNPKDWKPISRPASPGAKGSRNVHYSDRSSEWPRAFIVAPSSRTAT